MATTILPRYAMLRGIADHQDARSCGFSCCERDSLKRKLMKPNADGMWGMPQADNMASIREAVVLACMCA